MKPFKENYLIFVSIVGHGMILILATLQLNFSVKKNDLGEIPLNEVISYLAEEKFSPQEEEKKIKTLESDIKSAERILERPAKKEIPHPSKKSQQQQVVRKKSGNGKPIPRLIAMLHAAIQKEQRYPASALQMEREGQTTLMFKLFPNGTIDELRVVKSSGTAALDEAAIAAVNHAVPFKGIDKYLSTPQTCQVPVSFELA